MPKTDAESSIPDDIRQAPARSTSPLLSGTTGVDYDPAPRFETPAPG
ncbi:hypothetical protein [Streptomyces sp. NPDC001787]